MASYHIGEVCQLLDLKPHVLRYWEQEFSLLSPRKDAGGRRVYTSQELNLLYRIRHLLYVDKYTVDGARERLWRELEDDALDAKAHIHAVRGALIDSSLRARQLRRAANAVLIRQKLRSWGLDGPAERVTSLDPVRQERLLSDLRALPDGTIPWVLGLWERFQAASRGEPDPSGPPSAAPPGTAVSETERARAAEVGGGLMEAGDVTLFVPVRRMGELDRLAGAVAGAVERCGEAAVAGFHWVFGAPPRQAGRLRRRLEEGAGRGVRFARAVVEPGVPVPAVDAAGEPVVLDSGRLRLSSPGGAELLSRVLQDGHGLSAAIRERKLLVVLLNQQATVPCAAELGLHLLRQSEVSIWHRCGQPEPQLLMGTPEAVARIADAVPWRGHWIVPKGLTESSPEDDTRRGEIVEFRKDLADLALRGVRLTRLSDAPSGSASGGCRGL